jgi:hypothetical protein
MEDDPVIRYPMNFAAAMPALAASAAMIARLPDPADMLALLGLIAWYR